MIFTSSFKLDFLGIFVSSLIVLLAWHKWNLGYWKRKGMPGPKPSLFVGNAKEIIFGQKSMGEIFKDIYFDLKSKGHRHGGAYFLSAPNYIPVDMDIVKSVLQTDFQHFHSHGVYYNEKSDPLSANVFNLDGLKWKEIRSKLTPTFSSGKIKMMFPIIINCYSALQKLLKKCAKDNPVEIKSVMARFTMDVIGSCAFGLEIDSMKNPHTDFQKYGKKVLEASIENVIRNLMSLLIPHGILRALNHVMIPKESMYFFYNTVKSTIKYREENNIIRSDFMNLLLELKNNQNNEESLTVEEIAAQCFIFLIAGFEASSTTIDFASYELALNKDIQEKLRKEINTVAKRYNNELTYEAIMEMKYLEKVIQETLRKYPSLPFLFRKCTKNYKVPGEEKEVDKGVYVMISVLGIHYDPEYYPNPENFDPERFNEANKASRPQYSWIPFGEGPRICLGQRFGMLQTKIGLIALIRNFNISLNKKTISPIVFSKTGLITSSDGGIWLDLEPLTI